MTVFSQVDIEIINIYIGFKLRLARQQSKLSQHHLALQAGTDSTTIGRIERAEHMNSWSSILLVAQCLNIDYASLFQRPTKVDLLDLVRNCYAFETKLTAQKEEYYANIEEKINVLFENRAL